MKEVYVKPELVEEQVEIEDVIAASLGGILPGDNEGGIDWHNGFKF